MAKTLTEPTANQIVLDTYNRGMVAVDKLDLSVDQLYALCLIKLNNAVVPADYPALKAAIEAITGIQQISLVIDHHTRTTVPTDTKLVAVLEINLRLESTV
jgi:hypothetical protein